MTLLPFWLRLLLIALLLTGCRAPDFNRDDLCSIYEAHPEWESGVRQAEQQWGIPQELIMAVIRYESSFVGDAEAPRRHYFGLIPGERLSSAYGFSQALDQTWKEYQQRTGKQEAKRDQFADAADFIGWYLNRTHRSLQISRSDGYHLYLAYHEGHRGFLRKDYEKKPKLMSFARKVNTARMTYRVQLKACRPDKEADTEKRRFSMEINGGKPVN
ncbi:MAG: transglycosylase SLT domain-containing protein [Gammaproteobacteria bacterium]|mgnify:FL=1|jgi:hypothetical protein|nr:transglycosylase SLT domain-containing protein [Gammaproteobacteria bacterium]MBT4606672.1 transglycosylase SLT domain-containing protein [Thiotrichales bacterium]MBT3472941.1 transglycosylase SLT domain-containing protein [Gammaproteobacteria bacterium]MBT3966598.1 transglycosylase SLT domain-containing protein [Gammaproteobacteria bacterium]MBT4079122.1 transglycosylase SLT domain-containing protein [Gammaproteobacteria bacterium]